MPVEVSQFVISSTEFVPIATLLILSGVQLLIYAHTLLTKVSHPKVALQSLQTLYLWVVSALTLL